MAGRRIAPIAAGTFGTAWSMTSAARAFETGAEQPQHALQGLIREDNHALRHAICRLQAN